jgi:hypothetical protein
MLTESAVRIARRIPSGMGAGAISGVVETLAGDVARALGRRRMFMLAASVPFLACTITVVVIWIVQRLWDLPRAVSPETKIHQSSSGAANQTETSDASRLKIRLWLAKSMETEVVLDTQRGVVGEAIKNAARELEEARIAALEQAESQQTDASVKTTGADLHRKIEQLSARIERLTTEAAELYVRWHRNRQEREDIERALRKPD